MLLPFLVVTVIGIFVNGAFAGCPTGWLRAGGYCYWLSEVSLPFEDAQGVCSSKEATVVSLSTSLDLNAIHALLMSSPTMTQAWTCLRYDPTLQKWSWLDGTPYGANSAPWWGDTEPTLHSRGDTTEACAVLDAAANKMHRVDCTDQAAPVCRRSAYKHELCNEDDGWRVIGTSCYKTFTDQQTYWDADKTCRDNSATLIPLPFSVTVKSVIQESVVCDTSENDVWISSPNAMLMTSSTTVSKQTAGCNYVSVEYNLMMVTGPCLQERKFICVKPQGSCEEGWLSHEGRCYKAFSAQLPWFSAMSQCHDQQGAQLLTISDAEEQRFVQTQMIAGNFPRKTWLGLSDMNADGKLSPVDNAPITYTNWDRGFPVNRANVLDCVVISLGTQNATWSDGYCYKSLPYICEMSVKDDVRNKTLFQSCDPGWTLQGTACYQMGAHKNYSEALSFCAATGGHLATIHSFQDQAALAAFIPFNSMAWIGLHKYTLINRFVWEDTGTSPTTMTTNWLPGEPNNSGGTEECVQIVSAEQHNMAGAWNDNDCSKSANFICQRTPHASQTTPSTAPLVTAPWSTRCDEGWLLASTLDACYKLVTDVTVTWPAARSQCRRQGGDLVSITSHKEQTVVEAMAQSAGLAEGGQAWSGVWIGATDNTAEGGWEWTDGGPFRYLHWSAGQPDNTGLWGGEEQDCAVAVPANTFMWDDRNCGELHNYLCEKDASPLSTTAPQTGRQPQTAGQCPGWAMLSGDYNVADSMLTASTISDGNHSAAKSRMFPGNIYSWRSLSTDANPWIAVRFQTPVTVRGVSTTGGLALGTWVAGYKLRYRYDDDSPFYWYSRLPGGSPTVFPGNTDATTVVQNNIDLPFVSRQVFLYPVNWTGQAPTLRWELSGCVEDQCVANYAVSGPLVVPDDNLTASSVADQQHDPASARLHALAAGSTLSCWKPRVLDTSQWIQVDFERVEVVMGVSTRGNPGAAEWVTSYLLLFTSPSGDSQAFKPYEEPYGTPMLFTGNTDNNTTMTNYLKNSVPTQHIRLQPQAWNVFIAMQFDILVCQADTKCQVQPLLSDVDDEQLSATSSSGSHHGPQTSRLQPPGTSGIWGQAQAGPVGWQAEFARRDQYIQVTLDAPLEIQAVATQGRHSSGNWVTSYMLAFSSDGKTWSNYTKENTTTTSASVLPGNDDEDTVRMHYLTPFQALYVRLIPVTWHHAIALRWELYGCPGKNQLRLLGCYTEHANDRDLPYEPYTDPVDGMNPVLCSRHCFNKGYYFGGLQARDKCYCGNSYGRYGVSADCNLRCFPQQQFLCGGLNANFVLTTGLTSAFRVCPPGWTRLGGHCYSYFNSTLDWSSARAACGAVRGDLASVSDRYIDSLLYSLVGAAAVPQPTWFGLSDQRETQSYEWSNGEEVLYTNWDLHQPSSGLGSHCVAINNKTGGWMGLDCARRLPYLCMTIPRSSDEPPTVTAPKGCQAGMVAYASSCYVVTEEARTQREAADVCASFNGRLVSVRGRVEQAYLTSLLSSHQGLYWTDFGDVHNPGRFTYNDGQNDVLYSNWAPNMPGWLAGYNKNCAIWKRPSHLDSRRRGHCVAMAAGKSAGLWSSQVCTATLKAICELQRDGYPEIPIPPNPETSPCPVNWVSTNSTLCYQINNVAGSQQRTWAEARADCREQGGELASFSDTLRMVHFWRQALLGSSNHFWIGLHGLSTGVLEWSDRTPVSLDNPWATGQPDTRNGTQNCAELHVTSGTLALRDCSLTRNWLCAIPQGRKPFQRLKDRVVPSAGPPGSCFPYDDTWKRYGDYCYKVNTTSATWRQARANCQASQGDLASIADIRESMFILSLAEKTYQQSIWIGLSELQSGAGYYGWSDGSSVSFVSWAGQGPDDAGGQESCAELLVRTGKWNDNHCARSQGYVCKRYASKVPLTTPSTRPAPSGSCNDGFVVFGTRCYLIQGQTGGLKTWTEAMQHCRSISTPMARVQIASIRSHRENAFLSTQLSGTGMQVWVGLHLVNQTYMWVDNEELTFSNWDTGEPSAQVPQDGCVHLYSQGARAGRWNDADCSRRMGWVCESPEFPYWNMPTTPPSNCPGQFQRLGNSCYLYVPNPKTWAEAENTCQSQGAHLVSVVRQVEQDFVYLMASFNSSVAAQFLWLGLKGAQAGRSTWRWSWSDGWPVAYTNWAPYGDLHVRPGFSCVVMRGNGTWSRDNCTISRPFVCKTTTDIPPYTPAPLNNRHGVCDGRGWMPFAGRCFSFHFTDRFSFARATFECSLKGSGAALASVHDNATVTFLQSQVKTGSALPVWIGFKRSDSGGFSWRDGSPVDFTNWASNYPRGVTEDGTIVQCAQLTPWSGQWIDDDCAAEYGYVCMKNQVYETTSTSTARPSSHSSSSAASTPTTSSRHSSTTPAAMTSSTITSSPRHSTSTPAAVTPSASAVSSTSVTPSSPSSAQTMQPPHGDKQTGGGGDSGPNGGAIAGSVIGGLVVLALVVAAAVFLVRRHRDRMAAGFTNVLYSGADNAVHLS